MVLIKMDIEPRVSVEELEEELGKESKIEIVLAEDDITQDVV
jgi:hypothetical protein